LGIIYIPALGGLRYGGIFVLTLGGGAKWGGILKTLRVLDEKQAVKCGS